jgi:hypothetical protein
LYAVQSRLHAVHAGLHREYSGYTERVRRLLPLGTVSLAMSGAPGCLASIPDVIPVDGGTGDNVDGGPPPSRCANSSAVICEDFENPLNTAVWDKVTTSGASTVARDPSLAHSGAYSLHIHLDGSQSQASLSHIASPTNLPDDLYIRAFVYLATSPAPAPGAPESIMSVNSLDGASGTLLSRDSNSAFFLTDYGPGESHNWTSPSTAFPAVAAWTCVEWHIHATQPMFGSIDVSVNGGSAGLAQSSVELPTFEQLTFDVAFQVPPSTDFDVWFDDLYVDGAPVGCSK